MELLNNLAIGFQSSLSLINLWYAFMGAMLGTLIGVLPGLGPIATIAMLLPSMYSLEPTSALIMLAGIYYGAQYGGSTTAILINVPGEASSVVTALDGYQMARQGRAGAALAVSALGSFFAGTVGTLVIAAFAPPRHNSSPPSPLASGWPLNISSCSQRSAIWLAGESWSGSACGLLAFSSAVVPDWL